MGPPPRRNFREAEVPSLPPSVPKLCVVLGDAQYLGEPAMLRPRALGIGRGTGLVPDMGVIVAQSLQVHIPLSPDSEKLASTGRWACVGGGGNLGGICKTLS